MIDYTLRYTSEVRSQSDYFRDIKRTEIGEESLELAESLIAKRSARLDMSKFEDGYEIALRELVNAKVNHLPVPKDEVYKTSSGKVINLMDALRKSLGGAETVVGKTTKKPVASAKPEAKKGIGLVKTSSKTAAKRKSA